jgi:hypothetical protein
MTCQLYEASLIIEMKTTSLCVLRCASREELLEEEGEKIYVSAEIK